jgi:GrpB-like predicted nucleotidyltransferase (UPF0157 family)
MSVPTGLAQRSMLGLKRGSVRLANAHDQWALLFQEEKRVLLDTLSGGIIAVEHVGSTAIPGVPAKPIIDILMVVASIDNSYIQSFVSPLQQLGYSHMHSHPDRQFFAKGPEVKRTHHLNLVERDAEGHWQDPVRFRDYLRARPLLAEEYAALKTKLAARFADDRSSYTKAKEEFIRMILDRAGSESNHH